MRDKGAIILGGHIQALGIVRILGRLGIKCLIVDNTKKNIARHSSYCSGFIHSLDENLLSTLIKIGVEKEIHKWVIFPTNDYHVKVISQNKSLLEKYFSISTDYWNVVINFYNKCHTYRLAEKIGIPFPKTWFPLSVYDLSSMNISFPCIIKPAVMHEFYKKLKKKVFYCKDFDDLLNNYQKSLAIIPSEEIIVQEIIPGPSKNQYSACFLYLDGETKISLTACRMRQHPIDFGNATTYAETVDLPLLVDYGERILKEVAYNGLCEIEFKFDDRDNQFKFLEVNPRSWKWHSIANKTNTPFFENYFKYLCGQNIDATKEFRQASFYHFLTDFPISFILLLKGYTYWNRRLKPIENAVWAKDDGKPWFYEKFYLIYLFFSR